MSLEQIGKNAPDGTKLLGNHQNVLSGLGTTRTLLPAESGSLVLFDTAAGLVVTLPAPVAGMFFEFSITIDGTGSYSIDTDGAATFMNGAITGVSTTGGSADTFEADGSSIVSCDFDSTTTGEHIGTYAKFVAISSTVWVVSGTAVGTGTPATPFA
jgi:hypothetical protein